jgi:hypothetical protein
LFLLDVAKIGTNIGTTTNVEIVARDAAVCVVAVAPPTSSGDWNLDSATTTEVDGVPKNEASSRCVSKLAPFLRRVDAAFIPAEFDLQCVPLIVPK